MAFKEEGAATGSVSGRRAEKRFAYQPSVHTRPPGHSAPSSSGRGSVLAPAPAASSPRERFNLRPASKPTPLIPFTLTDTVTRLLPSPVDTPAEATGHTSGSAWGGLTTGQTAEQEQKRETHPVTEQREHTLRRRSYDLTPEQYRHLSDDQRRAVDYNTMLVDAHQKDLRAHYNPDQDKRETYQKAVEKMFGAGNGSEVFAPETLAVLQQLHYKPDKGDDFDDVLGLRTAITAHQVKNMTGQGHAEAVSDLVTNAASSLLGGQPMNSGEVAKTLDNFDMAAHTAHLEKKLAEGAQLMHSFPDSAAYARNDALKFFGGQQNKVNLEPGFGKAPRDPNQGNLDTWFRLHYDELAQKLPQANTAGAWDELVGPLHPEEMQQFMDYADLRSGQAKEFHIPLGGSKGAKYRSPEQYRHLLGLDQGGE